MRFAGERPIFGLLRGWLRAKQARQHPWEISYADQATPEDIIACFRLLLGRAPNREEWRGHSAKAGQALPGVVAGYVNSLEFARRGLLRLDHLGQLTLTELPGFSIYAAAADDAVGRHVQAGVYEPEVAAVFRGILGPGMGVIDLGANIGYFSMLSAFLVGEQGWVLAVEPNPANAKLLEASRQANGFDHVTVCQVAAAAAPGLLALHASGSNGTTAGLPDDVDALLAAVTVPCVRVDSLLQADRQVHLIKADVEGAEYNALRGCTGVIARDHPHLVTEFSPGLLPGISGISGPEYLRWVAGLGYRISVIQPDGSVGPPQDADAIMAEHDARESDHLDLLASPDSPAA